MYWAHTKFDFTVDEGNGRLNLLAIKNYGKHRRRKVFYTPLSEGRAEES